jgi:prepilin-type N-terminal cleavage/methylation domain
MRKLKEMTQKRMGNKGFSLVELIIVIAIMAVLVGILAPQYLKYVERSRIAADDSTAEQIKNGVNVLLTDDDYYEDITQGFTVTWTNADDDNVTIETTGTANATQLAAVVGGLNEYLNLGFDATGVATTDMKAKGHVPSDDPDGDADATTYVVTVTVTGGVGTVTSAVWND